MYILNFSVKLKSGGHLLENAQMSAQIKYEMECYHLTYFLSRNEYKKL